MNENDFARRLKPWLERSAREVGEVQAQRLKSARLRAMDQWREPVRLLGLVPVSVGVAQSLHYNVLQRGLLVAPVAALLLVLALKSTEPDLGELDAQLLTQELPPDAFLDQDFRSWLGKSHG